MCRLRSLMASWKDYQAFRHAFLKMTRQILTVEMHSSLFNFIFNYLFVISWRDKRKRNFDINLRKNFSVIYNPLLFFIRFISHCNTLSIFFSSLSFPFFLINNSVSESPSPHFFLFFNPASTSCSWASWQCKRVRHPLSLAGSRAFLVSAENCHRSSLHPRKPVWWSLFGRAF